jgi:hypothetical protein
MVNDNVTMNHSWVAFGSPVVLGADAAKGWDDGTHSMIHLDIPL